MGKVTGFIDFPRQDQRNLPAEERVKNYKEFSEIVKPDAINIDYNVNPKELLKKSSFDSSENYGSENFLEFLVKLL